LVVRQLRMRPAGQAGGVVVVGRIAVMADSATVVPSLPMFSAAPLPEKLAEVTVPVAVLPSAAVQLTVRPIKLLAP
jgi:hypothetical protein